MRVNDIASNVDLSVMSLFCSIIDGSDEECLYLFFLLEEDNSPSLSSSKCELVFSEFSFLIKVFSSAGVEESDVFMDIDLMDNPALESESLESEVGIRSCWILLKLVIRSNMKYCLCNRRIHLKRNDYNEE